MPSVGVGIFDGIFLTGSKAAAAGEFLPEEVGAWLDGTIRTAVVSVKSRATARVMARPLKLVSGRSGC